METTTLQRPSTGDEFEVTPYGVWTKADTSFETLNRFYQRFAESV